MTDSIRAIYEDGVLKPLDSLNLAEHQQVRVTVESIVSDTEGPAVGDARDPLAGVRVSTGIADLAERFDDYRFGRRHP